MNKQTATNGIDKISAAVSEQIVATRVAAKQRVDDVWTNVRELGEELRGLGTDLLDMPLARKARANPAATIAIVVVGVYALRRLLRR